MRIPMEDWLRGCVYHDGRHGEVTLSTDKVLEIANYIQLTRTSLADGMIELPPYDRKDEPQTMVYPQVDGITPSVIEPQTDLLVKTPRKSRESHEKEDEQIDCPWK